MFSGGLEKKKEKQSLGGSGPSCCAGAVEVHRSLMFIHPRVPTRKKKYQVPRATLSSKAHGKIHQSSPGDNSKQEQSSFGACHTKAAPGRSPTNLKV
jgi:hypothetical protein